MCLNGLKLEPGMLVKWHGDIPDDNICDSNNTTKVFCKVKRVIAEYFVVELPSGTKGWIDEKGCLECWNVPRSSVVQVKGYFSNQK